MNTKLLSTALLCLALTACSPDSDKKTDKLTVKDITDTSRCFGTSSVGTNLTSSTWESLGKFSNGALVRQTIEFGTEQTFGYGRLTMKAYGYYEGRASVLSASSPYTTYGSNQFEISESASDEGQIIVGDKAFRFSISLPAMTVSYTFKGPCLVLDVGDGKPSTMVPSY